jgi:hypothetical protein
MGRTEATETADADGSTAARLPGAAAVIATSAIPAAAIARRSALAIAPCPETDQPDLGLINHLSIYSKFRCISMIGTSVGVAATAG